MRLVYALLSALVMPSLLACSPESKSDTESTPGPERCSCIPDDVGGDMTSPSPTATCGDDLCPTILVDDIAGNQGTEVKNPDALTCAFDALTTKKPGVIRWSYKFNSSQYDEQGYIVIRDDGTLIRRNWGEMDLDYIVTDAVHGEAPDDAELAACTAMTDLVARFECLRTFNIIEIEICDEGWSIYGD
ncbi:hypothetical protein [Nannocystis punicea]|uniref:Lipoprotein n=1 Tax=Nannocystis punicea TaxID=2995304 RepID=A0ABY7GUM9_9BACT|nr:hypothetical protein [Nannocystis poenicansa]WAS90640.1 hypothetical protein O0S08_31010 [Nannocystis poenicansa]